MKKEIYLLLVFLFSISACDNTSSQIETWKQEIADTEKAFCEMAQKEGIVRAFEFYAAEDGVIKRGKNVIKGKSEIKAWYKNDTKPGDTLTWIPAFIDVSTSGDMGYTYGDYHFAYLDSLGNQKESRGIFHTVWKRQQDGSWRFVWD